MIRIDRRWRFGLIIVAVIIGLTLLIAPRGNRLSSGSTFSRAPDGYGAWYAYMQRQGAPIDRWRKPSSDFAKISGTGTTVIQVEPTWGVLSDDKQAWIERGNTWILLGATAPVTEAPFSTQQESDRGQVTIETARRQSILGNETRLLGDRFGAIVWEERRGKGRIVRAATPFLAANAYQEQPGNFAFLAKLARQNTKKIWVDEYLHGYKEAEVAKRETAQDWGDYLMKTPLSIVLAQTIVILLVLIWARNRRFGQAQPLETLNPNSSEAYTQALAGVLYKAGRSEFVVDVVGREEQLQIQRSLGIGGTLLDREALLNAWIEQTGRPAAELEQVLSKSKRLSETELQTWLTQINRIKQHLPK